LVPLFVWALPRSWYWEYRARDLDSQWGDAQGDFYVIEKAITQTHAKSVLDVGCGSGRMFPCFERAGVDRILGQDVSTRALRIARDRYRALGVSLELTSTPLARLGYRFGTFDLGVSNRTLSCVKPREIEQSLVALTRICHHLYINELTNEELRHFGTKAGGRNGYVYVHDYPRLLARLCRYTVVDSGTHGTQPWTLYRIGALL
jgi:SAM-dependent methyltransferase